MQKLVLKLLVCACIGSLCSCAQPAQPEEETLYVSILPLKSIVGGIVGDDFDVRVLVPAGASPETFEPTPRQFVDLNRARLIFNVGLIDFETTLLGKIEARDKVRRHMATGAEYITGADASCLMHQQGIIDHDRLPIKTIHIVEILNSQS